MTGSVVITNDDTVLYRYCYKVQMEHKMYHVADMDGDGFRYTPVLFMMTLLDGLKIMAI